MRLSLITAILLAASPAFSGCEYETSLGPNCELDCSACNTCSDAAEFLCGNGIVDIGEDCDTTPSAGSDSCDSECHNAACGNGVLEPGEECEIAIPMERGSCDQSCAQVGPIGCGNGSIELGEQCDDGNTITGDGCDGDCQWQDQRVADCGDLAMQPGEECDDGNTEGDDGCASNCQIESGWNCSYANGRSLCRQI